MRLSASACLLFFAFASFALLPAFAGASSVSYNSVFRGDGSSDLEALVTLSGPAGEYYWFIPQGTRVSSVSDSLGGLDYNIDGDKVFFRSRGGEEKISVFFASVNASNCIGPVCLAEFSLSAYDETTTISMRFENMTFFASNPPAFESSAILGNAVVRATGSFFLHASYLSLTPKESYGAAQEFEHYVVYAPQGDDYSKAFNEAEKLFGLISETTGLTPDCNRFLVISAPDNALPSFAGGHYASACLIRLKRSRLAGDQVYDNSPEIADMILHETTHGFMESLPTQNASWFKEGVSSFVAGKARDELEGINDSQPYVLKPFKVNGTNIWMYFFAQRMVLNDLENFYLDNGKNVSWTSDWSPYDEQNQTQRTFAYDYSRFIIASYVKKFGGAALQKAIAELAGLKIGNSARTSREDTAVILGALRSAAGERVSDDDLLYPFKSVLLSNGREAFKTAVGDLAYGETEVAEANKKRMEKILQEYDLTKNAERDVQELEVALIQNITEAERTEENLEGGFFDAGAGAGFLLAISVLVIVVVVPLVVLALIIYAAYRVLKKILKK